MLCENKVVTLLLGPDTVAVVTAAVVVVGGLFCNVNPLKSGSPPGPIGTAIDGIEDVIDLISEAVSVSDSAKDDPGLEAEVSDPSVLPVAFGMAPCAAVDRGAAGLWSVPGGLRPKAFTPFVASRAAFLAEANSDTDEVKSNTTWSWELTLAVEDWTPFSVPGAGG